MLEKKLPTTSYQLPATNRGFILPFAVLLSGVILSIGLAVFNIIIKGVVLSSSGRESQFAFYAADTASECALYWDAKKGIFATSSQSSVYSGSASCTEVSIMPFTSVVGNATAATTTFNIVSSNYCAKVTVAKYGLNTKIESEGFNTCNTSDPRRVERAIRITY